MKIIKTIFPIVWAIASLTLAIAGLWLHGELNEARLEVKHYQDETQVQGGANADKIVEEVRAALGLPKVYKTGEELRALFPWAQWLEAKQGETSFIFCAADLPRWGVSRMEIQGWVFRRYSNEWASVFTVRLTDVVDVKLSVDPKTGLFSAKGSADNEFKDKPVCTFDLRAAGDE